MESRFPAQDIEVLSATEAIRRRPSMFFDPDRPDIATELAMQALCHAADEAMDGRCRSVAVSVRGARVQVRYDCGMPLTADPEEPWWTVAEMFLLSLRACSSRKKHIEVGSQFCSIGLAVLNAMCRDMRVEIVDQGQHAQLRFERGEQIGSCEPQPSGREDGTRIEFELDAQVLAHAELSEAAMRAALAALAAGLPELTVSLDFQG